MKTVRLALVGCGWITQNHIKGYNDLVERGCDEFEITACVDPTLERAEEAAEAIAAFQSEKPKTFASIESMLKADIADAADVCVPHCFHHTAAIECMEGGLHVLLEKPLGITMRAGEMIIDAARRTNRILSTAEDIRRFQTARACAWAVTEAKLVGTVRAMDVAVRMYNPLDLNDPKFKWRAMKTLTGGGMIMDSGAHLTDMALVMFGEPETISCHMSTFEPGEVTDVPILGTGVSDVEDEWHAVITFKSGVRLTWSFSRVCPGENTKQGKIYGSEGVFVVDGNPMHPFQNGGHVVKADGSEIPYNEIEAQYLANLSEEEKDRLFPYDATNGFSVEVWDFIHAVRTGDAVEMDGLAGQKAKALAIACYESATVGRPVSFKEIMDGALSDYQQPIDDYWQLSPVTVG